MTTGTTSRTAHLLAPMNEGEDVGPGQPGTAGDQSPARAPGALATAAVAATPTVRELPASAPRTGCATRCPSGTTGVFDGPGGPWCLPPACRVPPRPAPGGAYLAKRRHVVL